MSDSKLAPLIVIEGIDGSGKGTQAQQLLQTLQQDKWKAELLSFPQYDQTFFGARIGDFLNGKFGALDELNPFLISLLYAADRFESRDRLQRAREQAEVVILDRYVPSNIAHQTAKLPPEQRAELAAWIEHIEYNVYQLPHPDLVILLDTPVDVSQRLIALKDQRSYTTEKADLQEADASYLGQVREVYRQLAQDERWKVVSLLKNDELRSIADIAVGIYIIALKYLNRTFF